MSVDSLMNSNFESYKDKFIQQALSEVKTQSEAKDFAILQANYKTTSLKNEINVLTERLDVCSTDMSKSLNHMKNINTQLAGPDLSPPDKSTLNHKLKYYEEMYHKAEKEQLEYTNELKNLGLFEKRDPIESDPQIVNSDFSELYMKFIDTIKDFLNVLSSEQLLFLIFAVIRF